MKAPVHILATVRKPELLRAALLSFQSLRTGFPTSRVNVWGNGVSYAAEQAIAGNARHCGARFASILPTSHDAWIEDLIQSSEQPFWIADTDLLFWDSLEGFDFSECDLCGRFEPAFDEEFTRSFHVERLHTALMWIDPARVRAGMRKWMAKIPPPFEHTAQFPFVRQHFIPQRSGQPLFYDTCAGLWHAWIGQPFPEAVDDCFDHLHCATYIDLIGPKLSTNLAQTHAAIYADPALAKGMRHEQAKYYARRAPGYVAPEKDP